jgi:hypothetical protein
VNAAPALEMRRTRRFMPPTRNGSCDSEFRNPEPFARSGNGEPLRAIRRLSALGLREDSADNGANFGVIFGMLCQN